MASVVTPRLTARLSAALHKTTTVNYGVGATACLPSRSSRAKFPLIQEVLANDSFNIGLHIEGWVIPD